MACSGESVAGSARIEGRAFETLQRSTEDSCTLLLLIIVVGDVEGGRQYN